MEETIWEELDRFIGSIGDEIRSEEPSIVSIDFWLWKIKRRVGMLQESYSDSKTRVKSVPDIDVKHPKKSVRHLLADYAHNAWSGWMKHVFKKSQNNDDGTVTIPSWAVSRWNMQMHTPYHDLPNKMKESDLKEADEILKIISKIHESRK